MSTVDSCRGAIFKLFIVEDKTLHQTREALKSEYNVNVTPKVLSTKLATWGYFKSYKRGVVLDLLRQRAFRESQGKRSLFKIRGRPVHWAKVEEFRRRERLHFVLDGLPSEYSPSSSSIVSCRTPPPDLPQLSPIIHVCRIPEKIFYELDILINHSFETHLWTFDTNNTLIVSSTSQESELRLLNKFLAHLTNGHAAFEQLDLALAGYCWQQAFILIEALVRAQYHDVIPNLLQKCNDLYRQGLPEVAHLLRTHLVNCSNTYLEPNNPRASIFACLGRLDVAAMTEIEERIMDQLKDRFEYYLGPACYNSFVVMMDGARRKLLRDPWATFEDHLPNMFSLDAPFGPSDRRSLDAIGLRLEVLLDRKQYVEVEAEAFGLISRAQNIEGDQWQRHYHLTRGWYYIGSAQYFVMKRDLAVESFLNALQHEEELSKLESFSIFDAEKVAIQNYLEHITGLSSTQGTRGGPS